MKLNLLGPGGIKGLALRHGEKIGMAIVGVCVALFLYSAAGRERLPADKQADVLMQKVNASTQKQNSYTWAEAVDASKEVAEGEAPPALFPVAFEGTGIAPVPVEPYAPSQGGWDRPVVPPTVLRTDPVLLTVTGLEVNGWSAIIPFVDEATRRKRMIEEAKRLEEEKKKADKLAQDAARDAQRGGRGRGGEGGFTGGLYGEGGYGEGVVDPNNPNRRLANVLARSEGVDLQGDELQKVVYGVTVLAKVPVEEQMKAYRTALENAKGGFDPMRDRPRYLGAFVERAELTGKELQWEPVKVRSGTGKAPWPVISQKTLPDAMADWPMEMTEIADQRYVHPLLTFPLPPLVGQNWGERAKLDEVPLQADYQPELEMENAAQPEGQPAEGDNLFGGPVGGQPGGGRFEGEGFGGGMRGGMRGGMGGGFRGGEGGFGEGMRGGMGGRFMGEGGMGGEMGMGGGGGGVRRSFDNMEEPLNEKPFWMFRFFDMTAEPGKQYRYRVKLVLSDVNGFVPRQYLDREVIARLPEPPKTPNASAAPPIRMTEWSEPSPAVSVPMAGEVRIAEVSPASDRQFNTEPSAKLLVRSFDLDEQGKAIQAALEEEFRRGSVMNFTKSAETLIGQYIDKVDNFRFRTGATLVDIRAGEKLPGELMSPSKVLVMDAGGKLSVRDELKDIGEVEQHRAIFAKPDPNSLYPGGARGGEFFRGEN